MNLLRLSISPLPVPAGWYALPLRLIVGFGFMQHGYAKLARGPEDFISVLHAMGLPVPFLLGSAGPLRCIPSSNWCFWINGAAT